MKVILIADVKGKGKKGDIVEVPRTYYVNYLLPNKKAKEATQGSLQDLKNQESSQQHQMDLKREDAILVRDKINGQSVDIVSEAGPTGVLHECITSSKIGSLIEEKFNVKVDRRKINIVGCEHGIRSSGSFSASVEFLPDVCANIFVNVN